jgi:hypothetical protein
MALLLVVKEAARAATLGNVIHLGFLGRSERFFLVAPEQFPGASNPLFGGLKGRDFPPEKQIVKKEEKRT